MKFEIVPYERIGPLDWSMHPEQVAKVLGAPVPSTKNRIGALVEFRKGLWLTCIYNPKSQSLAEVSISKKPGSVYLGTVDLLGSPPKKVLKTLSLLDPGALAGVGFIVFPKLGISVDGFYGKGEEKVVGAFARGQWDFILPQLKPFKLK